LFTWKLPPDVIETIVETPLTVQPFELVMAIRNVFEVTGDESVVVDEQFIKSPEIIPTGPVGPVAPVPPVGPVAPAPVGPVGPVPPVAPVGPEGPTGPPGVPEAPVPPVAPVGPDGPVGPTHTYCPEGHPFGTHAIYYKN
jgi:hypothetical protein